MQIIPEDMEILAAGLRAIQALDSAETSPADRANALQQLAAAGNVLANLDQVPDRVLWALHVYGGHSLDETAAAGGYGKPGGGRSLTGVRNRLERETNRRVRKLAADLAAAGADHQLVLPPAPGKAIQTAAAAAAELTQARQQGDHDAITKALENLLKAWSRDHRQLLVNLAQQVPTTKPTLWS
ncbi:hypothetical protein D5S17_29030 [Pseudonocardiaceae bacterium YIM PH 21723]|nr:hypothetical protein D5S17_29030 [Pseudonocardiaceae bacterium YIM PH 21723]